jgi:hypothetical protein
MCMLMCASMKDCPFWILKINHITDVNVYVFITQVFQ